MANLGKLAIAVLGILAYQNREKLGDMIRGRAQGGNGQGNVLDQLSKGTAGTPIGELLDRFRSSGAGAKVDSWIGKGANEPLEEREVASAIDEETLTSLSRQTGLSREELLARITQALPEAVDKMTPNGELPQSDGSREPTLLADVPPGSGTSRF